jgi:hypothetical protein
MIRHVSTYDIYIYCIFSDLNKAMVLLVEDYRDEQIKEEKKRLADLAAAENGTQRGAADNLPSLSRQGSGASLPISRQSSSANILSRQNSSGSNQRSGRSLVKKKSSKTVLEGTRSNGSNRKMNSLLVHKVVAEPPKCEYFGCTKIASVYAKISQLFNLMPFEFFPQMPNLEFALENAEKVNNIEYMYHLAFILFVDNFIHLIPRCVRHIFITFNCAGDEYMSRQEEFRHDLLDLPAALIQV